MLKIVIFLQLTSLLGIAIIIVTSKLGSWILDGGVIMNKETILQRSREETKKNKGDELETRNKDKSDHIATSVIFILILILNILNYFHVIDGSIQVGASTLSLTGVLLFLILTFVVVKLSSMYYYLRMKKYLVMDGLMILVLLMIIYRMCIEAGVL